MGALRPRAHPGGPRGAPRLWVPLLGGGFSVSPFPCCSYRVKEMSPSPRTPCSPWGGLGHRPGGPVAPWPHVTAQRAQGHRARGQRGAGTSGQGCRTQKHWDTAVGTWGHWDRAPRGQLWGRRDTEPLGTGDAGTRGHQDARGPMSPPRAVAGLYGVPPHPKKSPVAQGDLSGEVLGAETHFWCFPLLEPNE